MSLFAQRFLTTADAGATAPPGRYDELRALRLDAAGEPVVDRIETSGLMTTKADVDREAPLAALGTRGDVDPQADLTRL